MSFYLSLVLSFFLFFLYVSCIAFSAAAKRTESIHVPMAKRKIDANADINSNATRSAVRVRRILQQPLQPGPLRQIDAAEPAQTQRYAAVTANDDNNDSSEWDENYIDNYLRNNPSAAHEGTRAKKDDDHAITQSALAVSDIDRTGSLYLTADEQTYVAECCWKYRHCESPLSMALLVAAGKRNLDGSHRC